MRIMVANRPTFGADAVDRFAIHADLLPLLLLAATAGAMLAALVAGLLCAGFARRRVRGESSRLAEVEAVRLEQAVAQRTAQLTELAHHLQIAREDERARLARDLHDELGALLTSAKLDAARIRARLAGSAPEVLVRLAHLVDMLDRVIAFKRTITEVLMPSSLGHLGLVASLEILAREFGEASGVDVHCTLAPVALEPAVELTIYRLVQEAVNNIGKHAQAGHVWIGLAAVGDQVEVTVRDDGIGFLDQTRPGRSYGLVGMRFRVEAEQGTLAVSSQFGQGTLVRARLPQAVRALATA
jgi:signal transduction histidine kinase